MENEYDNDTDILLSGFFNNPENISINGLNRLIAENPNMDLTDLLFDFFLENDHFKNLSLEEQLEILRTLLNQGSRFSNYSYVACFRQNLPVEIYNWVRENLWGFTRTGNVINYNPRFVQDRKNY